MNIHTLRDLVYKYLWSVWPDSQTRLNQDIRDAVKKLGAPPRTIRVVLTSDTSEGVDVRLKVKVNSDGTFEVAYKNGLGQVCETDADHQGDL